MKGLSLGLSHSSLIYEFKMSSLSLVYGFRNLGSFGFGLNYIDLGNINETTIYEPDGTGEVLQSKDMLFVLAYSRIFLKRFSAGFSAKYIVSKLAGEEAKVYCFDLGVIYALTPNLSLGLWGTNLGPEVTYISESDPLPFQYRFGCSYSFPGVIISVDAVQDAEEGFGFAYGTQLDVYKDTFIFRIGRKTYDSVSSLSAGVSIKYLKFRVDYTFNSVSEKNLYDFNQISIGYNF
ncbi:MAG TPA: PorV/PorQ family protein [Firmicutes bacterium]|nr:PorV/PorQ family protein [Bacillota bacterium]